MAFLPSRRPANFLEQFSAFRDIDDLFRGIGRNWPAMANATTLAIDVKDEDRNYIVEASAAGATRKDFELSFENGMLTIQYNHNEESEDKGANYLVRERVMTSAARSVNLPLADTNADIKAALTDGVLRISIPKMPEKQTRKIEIR